MDFSGVYKAQEQAIKAYLNLVPNATSIPYFPMRDRNPCELDCSFSTMTFGFEVSDKGIRPYVEYE